MPIFRFNWTWYLINSLFVNNLISKRFKNLINRCSYHNIKFAVLRFILQLCISILKFLRKLQIHYTVQKQPINAYLNPFLTVGYKMAYALTIIWMAMVYFLEIEPNIFSFSQQNVCWHFQFEWIKQCKKTNLLFIIRFFIQIHCTFLYLF